MKFGLSVLVLSLLVAEPLLSQNDPADRSAGTTGPKRSWMSRLFHHSPGPVQYKDARLRGLEPQLQISPQPLKLSETRQMEVRMVLVNRGKHAIQLDFPTDQRVEIYLRNSAEQILTKWSDNHAVTPKPETVLINPDEHVEYVQTIATRELTPDKVFIVEVFLPDYPELRIRQKFLTEP